MLENADGKYYEKWNDLKLNLEMAIISLMHYKGKASKITKWAYENVLKTMKSIEKMEGEDDKKATQKELL